MSATEYHRALLLRVARRAMLEHGLEPDFPAPALAEAQRLTEPALAPTGDVRDLRALPWCSIDNDDSRDLDQLTVAESLDGGRAQLRIAIADVSTRVGPGSALDAHAHANTTSVYTPPQNFPMLPERLSTDLTSLGANEDRLAIVVEIEADGAGATPSSNVYRALVRNRAKLAYPSVGAWLANTGAMPPPIAAVPGLADNLRLQDRIAQGLRARRFEHGAMELETLEVHAQFDGDTVSGLTAERRDRAKELIEDSMIAANGAIARFLEAHRFPVVRRVLRTPERWDRIVAVALEHGGQLPGAPDPRALHDFLVERHAQDPLHFPDLSLTIVKLLGNGEYAASFPGEKLEGHFGLAVSEYTHSTAPNRRYPDLVTQRMVGAALAGHEVPYDRAQLEELARHCTQKEDDAQKVERLMRKAAAACWMSDQIGREFDGVVTGVSPKGTWVRTFDPPVEGRVEQGAHGLDVGDTVRVKLIHTDAERGFIDFARLGHVAVGGARTAAHAGVKR